MNPGGHPRETDQKRPASRTNANPRSEPEERTDQRFADEGVVARKRRIAAVGKERRKGKLHEGPGPVDHETEEHHQNERDTHRDRPSNGSAPIG